MLTNRRPCQVLYIFVVCLYVLPKAHSLHTYLRRTRPRRSYSIQEPLSDSKQHDTLQRSVSETADSIDHVLARGSDTGDDLVKTMLYQSDGASTKRSEIADVMRDFRDDSPGATIVIDAGEDEGDDDIMTASLDTKKSVVDRHVNDTEDSSGFTVVLDNNGAMETDTKKDEVYAAVQDNFKQMDKRFEGLIDDRSSKRVKVFLLTPKNVTMASERSNIATSKPFSEDTIRDNTTGVLRSTTVDPLLLQEMAKLRRVRQRLQKLNEQAAEEEAAKANNWPASQHDNSNNRNVSKSLFSIASKSSLIPTEVNGFSLKRKMVSFAKEGKHDDVLKGMEVGESSLDLNNHDDDKNLVSKSVQKKLDELASAEEALKNIKFLKDVNIPGAVAANSTPYVPASKSKLKSDSDSVSAEMDPAPVKYIPSEKNNSSVDSDFAISFKNKHPYEPIRSPLHDSSSPSMHDLSVSPPSEDRSARLDDMSLPEIKVSIIEGANTKQLLYSSEKSQHKSHNYVEQLVQGKPPGNPSPVTIKAASHQKLESQESSGHGLLEHSLAENVSAEHALSDHTSAQQSPSESKLIENVLAEKQIEVHQYGNAVDLSKTAQNPSSAKGTNVNANGLAMSNKTNPTAASIPDVTHMQMLPIHYNKSFVDNAIHFRSDSSNGHASGESSEDLMDANKNSSAAKPPPSAGTTPTATVSATSIAQQSQPSKEMTTVTPSGKAGSYEKIITVRKAQAILEYLNKDPLESWRYEYSSLKELGLNSTILRSGLVNTGNIERLKAVMKRALKGEDITLSIVGGSISAGGGLYKDRGNIEGLYYKGVVDWWSKMITPLTGSDLVVNNIAIGSIGTDYFSYCIKAHISNESDIVLWELAGNDYNRYKMMPTKGARPLERLTRMIMELPDKPALMYINFFKGVDFKATRTSCPNFEDQGEDVIAHYYKIPSLSWRAMVCDHLVQKDPYFTLHDLFSNDQYHPSLKAHAQMALLLLLHLRHVMRAVLQWAIQQNGYLEDFDANYILPIPLFMGPSYPDPLCWTLITPDSSNKIHNSIDVRVVRDDGFKIEYATNFPIRFDRVACWKAERPGAEISLMFKIPESYGPNGEKRLHSEVAITTHTRWGGSANIWIDHKKDHPLLLKEGRPNDPGKRTQVDSIEHDLAPGTHTLTVRSMDGGFCIAAIMIDGS